MKWTVESRARLPLGAPLAPARRVVVEADTLEAAIVIAAPKLYSGKGAQPSPGERYLVSASVEVVTRPSVPLRNI